MTTATKEAVMMKILAEMTSEELTALKGDTYDVVCVQHRAWDMMSPTDPRWSALHDGRRATLEQYHRIDDELYRRGA